MAGHAPHCQPMIPFFSFLSPSPEKYISSFENTQISCFVENIFQSALANALLFHVWQAFFLKLMTTYENITTVSLQSLRVDLAAKGCIARQVNVTNH